uniref:Uncharacterized protein n=1 Tax=uncultured prokaryote TaxID=198431 RepID=A0A0H5Q8J8_9ZZZZ|nr:hypothetical protein [uncultured prokaryote]
MPLHRAQVTFGMDSGLSADSSTNTWYFFLEDDSDRVEALAALATFYGSVGTLMSILIDNAAVTCDWYRMEDPSPRSPWAMNNILPFAAGASSGPTEVALVLSFEAAKESGSDQRRRRGRIYLGPLNAAATDRPNAGFVAVLRDAGAALLAASDLATGWSWVQYSPTNEAYNEIASGWVDNEWDTQRRRGRKATTRSTF